MSPNTNIQKERWLDAQKNAFRAAVSGATLEQSLAFLTNFAAAHGDGIRGCAIYAGDGKGGLRHIIGMSEELAIGVDPRTRWSFPLDLDTGKHVGSLVLHFHEPRALTDADLELADKLTQIAAILVSRHQEAEVRALAEARLRYSEERFQQFAQASSGALWVRDASSLKMEYVSPAVAKIYGVEPDAFLGDVRLWGASIVPEDRAAVLEHLERARGGEAVVHEFRIQRPTDLAFRWIRSTDFPLRDERGDVHRIGGIAEDVTEARLAIGHEGVLLAELQHRVRNIMGILRAIAARTGERAESVAEYTELMTGRMFALARVQALLTRRPDMMVGIATLVRDEVAAHAQQEAQFLLEGPDVELSPKAAEILTLVVHELSTNALKYGALSAPQGKVTVRWALADRNDKPWLTFDWVEEGAPPRAASPDKPRHRGFGSELIEARVPYELRGKGKITLERGGARCHLEFPLQDGASVLETSAPVQATVFGGALDMTHESKLNGRRVLVVEDEYYIATDTARALQGAGAVIMGPCPTEDSAREELEGQRPDAVVVDINLGAGPSYKLAQSLKDRGIPFLFLTGYDPEVIPSEFADVERLQKPLQLRQIVAAVSKLLEKPV